MLSGTGPALQVVPARAGRQLPDVQDTSLTAHDKVAVVSVAQTVARIQHRRVLEGLETLSA